MSDLHDLEAAASRTPMAVDAADHDRLARHFWGLAEAEAGYRERLRLLKRSSFFAGHALDRGLEEVDSLRLYMDILGQTARVHSFPQDLRRTLSKVTVRWLEATGAAAPRLIDSRKGKIATETAAFALGDVGHGPDPFVETWIEKEIVAWMRSGQRLLFGTGYDGRIGAELRIIDGDEPVLEAKEYARLDSSTPTLVLEVPTGRIGLADYAEMARPWPEASPPRTVSIGVPPGRYKASVYGFSTRRSDRVIAVLCPTESNPPNEIDAVDSLFM